MQHKILRFSIFCVFNSFHSFTSVPLCATMLKAKGCGHLKELLQLFYTFARVGTMTFGGGYAMLPILQREVVESRHLATEEELTDYFAIGQCTPGVIAVNTATFVGYKRKGVLGAVFATVGVVLPSLLIITFLAGLISKFSHLPAVIHAFNGIRVAVTVLIFNSVIKLFKKAVIDKTTAAIFIIVFAGAVLTELSVVVFVLLAALAGIALSFFKGREAQQ